MPSWRSRQGADPKPSKVEAIPPRPARIVADCSPSSPAPVVKATWWDKELHVLVSVSNLHGHGHRAAGDFTIYAPCRVLDCPPCWPRVARCWTHYKGGEDSTGGVQGKDNSRDQCVNIEPWETMRLHGCRLGQPNLYSVHMEPSKGYKHGGF